MAVTAKKWQGVIAGTAVGTASTLVTNGSDTTTLITHMTLVNQDTSDKEVRVFAVDASGGLADSADEAGSDSNWIFVDTVSAGDVTILGSQDLKIVLDDVNDTIKAYAATANVINYYLVGFEIT